MMLLHRPVSSPFSGAATGWNFHKFKSEKIIVSYLLFRTTYYVLAICMQFFSYPYISIVYNGIDYSLNLSRMNVSFIATRALARLHFNQTFSYFPHCTSHAYCAWCFCRHFLVSLASTLLLLVLFMFLLVLLLLLLLLTLLLRASFAAFAAFN